MKRNFKTRLTRSDLDAPLFEAFNKSGEELGKAYSWNNDTINAYRKEVKKLQEFLADSAPTSFLELDFEDYENAINAQILARRQSGKPAFAVGTIQKRRNILMQFCEYASTLNIGYSNPLWGCYWKHRTETAQSRKSAKNIDKKVLMAERQEEIAELVSLPKSLTISSENKLARLLSEQICAPSGEFAGGLLMLYLGLRPGECCAVKYDNIKKITAAKTHFVLYVFEQLDSKNKLRNTLKTKNAYRILPIPEELYMLLSKRKTFVRNQVGANENIEDYPIVNAANGFNKNIRRKDFSSAMVRMLRLAALNETVLSYASAELASNKNIREAEATGYLLRRNFATVMSSVCALTEEELQYLMGHSLEDNSRRSDFADPEALMRLAQKMDKRHVIGLFTNKNVKLSKEAISTENIGEITISVDANTIKNSDKTGIIIDIYNDCPADVLSLHLKKLGNEAVNKAEPALKINCDYKKQFPETVGRISTVQAYYKAMNSSRNKSDGHLKKEKK